MPDDNDAAAIQAAAEAATLAAAEASAAKDAELTAARAELTAATLALTTTTTDLRDALHAAHPDLPDAAFTGADAAALKASVASARAIADHVKANIKTTATTATVTPAAGGTVRNAEAPAGRGIDRIRQGIEDRRR